METAFPAPENPHSDTDSGLRDRLADAVATEAVFDGWCTGSLTAAGEKLGLPAGEAGRLFPGGAVQVVTFLAERADRRTVADLEAAGPATMKVRERIKLAVRLRIERHAGEKDAVRRALARLALPLQAGLGLRLLYKTVDAMWYAAGDTSTDFNFYTKRALLAGVYSSTLLYWLNDRSPGNEATWRFLDRRIEDVMQIEKLKARIKAWSPTAATARR